MDLTNREISLAIWLAIFFTYFMIREPGFRKALYGVFLAFSQRKLLILFCSSALYVVLIVVAFAKLEIWTIANLKATLLWFMSFMVASLFDVARFGEPGKESVIFRKIVRDIFSISGIVTFVSELYTFNIFIEFILFPIIVIFSISYYLSSKDEKSEYVRKFLLISLTFIGSIFLIYSVAMSVSNFSDVATIDTLREFGTPFLLSVAFLPYLYVIFVVITYETVFTVLSWQITDDNLRSWAKKEAVLRFGLKLKLLKRWAAEVARSRPANAGEMRRCFNETISADKHETKPPFVKQSEGWSPYKAMSFLKEYDLYTNNYHRSLGDEWFAGTPYLELGNASGLRNNIAYYITGEQNAATSLKLCLNVNETSEGDAADAKFIEIGYALLKAALNETSLLSESHEITLLEKKDINLNGCTIQIRKDYWVNGAKGGYSRSITIIHVKLI